MAVNSKAVADSLVGKAIDVHGFGSHATKKMKVKIAGFRPEGVFPPKEISLEYAVGEGKKPITVRHSLEDGIPISQKGEDGFKIPVGILRTLSGAVPAPISKDAPKGIPKDAPKDKPSAKSKTAESPIDDAEDSDKAEGDPKAFKNSRGVWTIKGRDGRMREATPSEVEEVLADLKAKKDEARGKAKEARAEKTSAKGVYHEQQDVPKESIGISQTWQMHNALRSRIPKSAKSLAQAMDSAGGYEEYGYRFTILGKEDAKIVLDMVSKGIIGPGAWIVDPPKGTYTGITIRRGLRVVKELADFLEVPVPEGMPALHVPPPAPRKTGSTAASRTPRDERLDTPEFSGGKAPKLEAAAAEAEEEYQSAIDSDPDAEAMSDEDTAQLNAMLFGSSEPESSESPDDEEIPQEAAPSKSKKLAVKRKAAA